MEALCFLSLCPIWCQLLWWFGSEVKNCYSLFLWLKVLKTGSDKIIDWLGRYYFLLGFNMAKNPKDLWFYILIESSVRNLSHFFDIIKPRRKEYLPTQKIISSDPVFGYFAWMMPNLKFKYWMNGAKLTCEDCSHSRSQQRTDQRVIVLTLKFLALKKLGFPP